MPLGAAGEVLIRVEAAGVGVWDAWIRSGRSVLPQPLPLTLGSDIADIAGVVQTAGVDVTGLRPGDEVYGVTNQRFTGGYAEFAIAGSNSMAHKPVGLSFIDAASVPITAVTAW